MTDIIYTAIRILAGFGAFLLGVKLLGDNLERIAGNKLKSLFDRTSQKTLAGVGLGAVTTAVVQSSSVTAVMVVGFVNSGVMSLSQAASLLLGANIGTVITAQLAALQSFDAAAIFMAFVLVGVLVERFSKKDKAKSGGLALAGFGLVFLGLDVMSGTLRLYMEGGGAAELFSGLSNPVLLLLLGALLAALVQSSGAVAAVVVTVAAGGFAFGGGGNAALFLLIGTGLGSVVAPLISALGANADARRAAAVYLLYNLFSALLLTAVLLLFPNLPAQTFGRLFAGEGTRLAMFYTAAVIVCDLILLPLKKPVVRLVSFIVRHGKKGAGEGGTFMDERILSAPTLAIGQLTKEIFRMADMSVESLRLAFEGFLARDLGASEKVAAQNEEISSLGEKIGDYLVRVSANGISLDDEKLVCALHNDVGDVVRISELADNITKYTRREVHDNLIFSAAVGEKISAMHDLLRVQYGLVRRIALDGEYTLMEESDKTEDKIDAMRRELIADHIARMSRGECRPENNTVFINLVSNLERIGDHLSYIAHSTDNL